MKADNPKTWMCPFCYTDAPFGKFGCDNADTCPETKNYVYMMTRKFPNGRGVSDRRGVGISEIANQEDQEK